LLFLAYAEYFPVVHHEMFLSCQGVVRPATDVPHTRHGVITGPPFCFTGGALNGRRGRGQVNRTGVRRESGDKETKITYPLLDQTVHEYTVEINWNKCPIKIKRCQSTDICKQAMLRFYSFGIPYVL
jgi:hypothetical protein